MYRDSNGIPSFRLQLKYRVIRARPVYIIGNRKLFSYIETRVVIGRTTAYCKIPCLQLCTNSRPIVHGVIQHNGNICLTGGLNSSDASKSISKFR